MIITKAVIYAAGAALLASLAWGGVQCSQKKDAQYGQLVAEKALAINAKNAAEAARQTEADARAAEQNKGQAMANIGSTHEEDRRDAESVPAAVVAAVQSGDLRLRDDLARCHTDRLSDAATGAGERHATAELRAEVAGDLVRVVRDADDQLRACQAVVIADRAAQ